MSKREPYSPPQDIQDAFPDISGNTVNGLGEAEYRRPGPFFWHPPERHSHGGLAKKVLKYLLSEEKVAEQYRHVLTGGPVRGPERVEQAAASIDHSPEEWSTAIKQFATANEADVVGIATMRDDYVFEGYQDEHRFIVVLAVAHDYEQIKGAPASSEITDPAVEIGRQYNRGARAASKLRNYILEQGYPAKDYPGPYADAINLIPAAIEAGMGELGKHGSLIHRELGSSFRLAAVTTDMPLVADSPDSFGADDFCTRCQACERACPPDAIYSEKQLVRGVEKWYVDFDKCIPFFAESYSCGACIVACPWSKPGVAENLLMKIARRNARQRVT